MQSKKELNMKNQTTNIWTLIVGFILITISVPVLASYIVPPNGVTTATIVAGAVTQSKMAPRPGPSFPSPYPSVSPSPSVVPTGGIAISLPGSITGAFSGAIPNNSVTIVTTGRPVVVGLMCEAGAAGCWVYGSGTTNGYVNFIRTTAGTPVTITQEFFGYQFIPPSSFSYIDFVPAGTYTYTDFIAVSIGTYVNAVNTAIYAYEM